MLGRTANNVYWMARYVERAENLSRLLASTYHMSLLPGFGNRSANHWDAPLVLADNRDDFTARYGDATSANVVAYMALDSENTTSIRSCIRQARENARATRTALTTEVWESINETYFDLEQTHYAHIVDSGYQEFFDRVKARSHLFRGAIYGTMRRADAFTFSRLGTFIERADNTARFLAIKWQVLLPNGGKPMAAEEYYLWGSLLRAFSAFKAYREVYSGIIEPRRVAELLVLRDDMPRSLLACAKEMAEILRDLRGNSESARKAAEICDQMHRKRIDGILRSGLPRYLNGFVARNAGLHQLIGREFMLVL